VIESNKEVPAQAIFESAENPSCASLAMWEPLFYHLASTSVTSFGFHSFRRCGNLSACAKLISQALKPYIWACSIGRLLFLFGVLITSARS
jgi:hypothetical protein